MSATIFDSRSGGLTGTFWGRFCGDKGFALSTASKTVSILNRRSVGLPGRPMDTLSPYAMGGVHAIPLATFSIPVVLLEAEEPGSVFLLLSNVYVKGRETTSAKNRDWPRVIMPSRGDSVAAYRTTQGRFETPDFLKGGNHLSRFSTDRLLQQRTEKQKRPKDRKLYPGELPGIPTRMKKWRGHHSDYTGGDLKGIEAESCPIWSPWG